MINELTAIQLLRVKHAVLPLLDAATAEGRTSPDLNAYQTPAAIRDACRGLLAEIEIALEERGPKG